MPKHPSLSRDAAQFARASEQELAQMQRALHAAEDNLAGLRRMLKVPVIKPTRAKTKTTRSTPSLLDRAGQASLNNIINSSAKDIVGGIGSFYTSAAQGGSDLLAALKIGQRIL